MPLTQRNLFLATAATCIIAILFLTPATPIQAAAQAHAQPNAPAGTGSISGTGAYSFDNLKPGHYSVLFESKGLISKTQSVEVKASKKSKVSERLKPPEVKKKTDVE